MPTPISAPDKAAFIAVVAPVNSYEADRLVTILNNYEDVPIAINRQIDAYAANNGYLIACMSTLSSDADLMAVGIYVNKTATAAFVDPVLLINCTYSTNGAGISYMNSSPGLSLLGNTVVDTINVTANRTVQYIYIGPGAAVNIINSSPQGACVFNVYVKYLATLKGALNRISTDSCIGRLIIDPGAFYGGRSDSNPLDACAIPVTGMNQTMQTHDAVKIFWTLPAPPWSFINIFYREQGSNTYLAVEKEDGQWAIDFSYYTFMRLKGDTFYEIKVEVTCVNGGIAATVLSDVQTNASP